MATRSLIRGAPPVTPWRPPRRVRYRRWATATTLGELAGFAIPALVGTIVAAAGLESLAAAALLVLAGTGEGAVLGWAQSRALRHDLPGLSAREWTGATAAGAALAWAIGMAPSTFFELLRPLPWPLLVVLAVPAGLALLATIGAAQWLVLRRHVEGASVWVVANALGWLAGLVVVFVAVGVAPASSPALIVAFSVLGGLGMGLTVALVTGAFLIGLLDHPLGGPRQR
jgi:hypothetical protein